MELSYFVWQLCVKMSIMGLLGLNPSVLLGLKVCDGCKDISC